MTTNLLRRAWFERQAFPPAELNRRLFIIAPGLQQLGSFLCSLIQRRLDFLFVGYGLQDVSCYDGTYIEKIRHRRKWFSNLEGCTGGRIPAIFLRKLRIIKHRKTWRHSQLRALLHARLTGRRCDHSKDRILVLRRVLRDGISVIGNALTAA